MFASISKDGIAVITLVDIDLQQLGCSQDSLGCYALYTQTKSGFRLQLLSENNTSPEPNKLVYKLTRVSNERLFKVDIKVPLKYFEPSVEAGFRYRVNTVIEPGPTLHCTVLLDSKENRRSYSKKIKPNITNLDEATKCVKYLNSLVDQQILQVEVSNGKVRFIIE